MGPSLLDLPLYSLADVDRLLQLPPGTARRWLEGYSRDGVYPGPVLRHAPTDGERVTWGEMVEARLLTELRAPGVWLESLGPVLVRLREEFGRYPLARAAPFQDVAGREFVHAVQHEVDLEPGLRLVAVESGHLVLTEPVRRFQSAVEYKKGKARRLTPVERTPSVRLDPRRFDGRPSIHQVPVKELLGGLDAGLSRDALAEIFSITPRQVGEAVRFELIISS